MASPDGRVRLTVLGGFLGSGKTTWLRHHLHEGAFGKALVVVNEAAETPVDDVLLLRSSERIAMIAGGCACCTGRANLIALLRQIADERSRTGPTGERLLQIVLETSGLADPGAIVDAIRTDPVLVHHVVVGEIVVTVDAIHGLDQLRGEPLGRRQVESADRLVVTKIDETRAEETVRLLATLRAMNPGATLSGAVHGSTASLPDFSTIAAERLGDVSDAVAEPIFATQLHIDETVDWTAFSLWLSALLHARGDSVMRVKGVVRTPAGRLLLQSVRKVVQSPEKVPEVRPDQANDDNTIVVIGRGYDAEALRRSLRHFAAAGRK